MYTNKEKQYHITNTIFIHIYITANLLINKKHLKLNLNYINTISYRIAIHLFNRLISMETFDTYDTVYNMN